MLLGSNGAGKSSALRALKFFFEGDSLEPDDIYGRDPAGRVSVQLTFDELTDSDKQAFGPYATGSQMVLTRQWVDGKPLLTGRGLQLADFGPIRAAQGKDRTRLYKELREAQEALDLPAATNMADVDAAMLAWEMEHPDRCDEVEQDAGRLLGYTSVGQSAIGSRFKFVFVPGLRDAAEEAMERRGSLLERLLTAIADQRVQANERLSELEQDIRERYAEVVQESHGPTLDGLAESLETHMRRYVPTAGITLRPIHAELRIGAPAVELRGGESQDLTDLGRQGHGFQRTFIIAALEYLAETAREIEEAGDAPSLFLAIEEPELYQHPPRARHFARTLRNLAVSEAKVQVCYATHSPYFVAPQDFPKIRLFRRVASDDSELPATVSIAAATRDEVASVLDDPTQTDRLLARTIHPAFSEAFFARAALIVEGPTEQAAFEEAARMMGKDLGSLGVVTVPASKSRQPVAIAVLRSLAVPTYAVFDGDENASDRDQAEQGNRRILRALGVEGDIPAFPPTEAHGTWACMSTDFETYLAETIPDFSQKVDDVARELGWSKPKSPEVYAEVLDQVGVDDLPPLVKEILETVLAMAE